MCVCVLTLSAQYFKHNWLPRNLGCFSAYHLGTSASPDCQWSLHTERIRPPDPKCSSESSGVSVSNRLISPSSLHRERQWREGRGCGISLSHTDLPILFLTVKIQEKMTRIVHILKRKKQKLTQEMRSSPSPALCLQAGSQRSPHPHNSEELGLKSGTTSCVTEGWSSTSLSHKSLPSPWGDKKTPIPQGFLAELHGNNVCKELSMGPRSADCTLATITVTEKGVSHCIVDALQSVLEITGNFQAILHLNSSYQKGLRIYFPSLSASMTS